MSLWTAQELIEALSDELLEHNLQPTFEADEVVIDSRKTPKSGLFVALKGEKNDGHDFLEESYKNGCKAALIQDKNRAEKIKNLQFLLVKDTFKALYKLAEFSRQRSKAKIIGITGSVGKTGTKEMLRDAFAACGKTFATFGNLNNHFGVPLSLCNFSADCDYGIFEMGMNHPNEIEPLSRLTKPHIAIITNVGPVHIENFENEEGIALAKSEIFTGVVEGGMVLINRDNRHFEFLQKRAQAINIKDSNIISFGKKNPSNYQILKQEITNVSTSVVSAKLKNGREFYYQISSSHAAVIFNSIIAVACLDLLGSDLQKGIQTFQNLKTPKGRGNVFDVKVTDKNLTIIDDTYNASLLSVHSGLEHAASLKNNLHKKRLLVALGDMLELGKNSVELHETVMKFLSEFAVDFAILVGKEMTSAAQKKLKIPYKTFSDSSLASLEISELVQDGDLLYVKGSRGIKMEKIIEKIVTQNQ